MNSDQFLNSLNIPQYSQPQQIDINYNSNKVEIYQNNINKISFPDEYPVANYNHTNNINIGDIMNINSLNQGIENPLENISNTYMTQFTSEYQQQQQQQNNNYIDTNINNNINENSNIQNNNDIMNMHISNNNNNKINPKENELLSNVNNKDNENNLLIQNQNKDIFQIAPIDPLATVKTLNEESQVYQSQNNENKISPESQMNSEILNQSFPRPQKREKNISPPNFVNELESNIQPSSLISDIRKENEKKYNLTKDEEILLKRGENIKEYDINSHFELTLIKKESTFFYNKVYKIATPLLAHYEMPENLEYISPILSPNGKFLACIGKGVEDSVFVWDISDLYWYKYKYSYSSVGCIMFTPNSKSIIIVYNNFNPIIYDLSTGKLQLEFESNELENNREGYKCAFTHQGTHFALTTTKSFTLWDLKTGKIIENIIDNSPIKIISNDYLITIDSQFNCFIKQITDFSIIESFQIKGVGSIEQILDAKFNKDMTKFLYVIKHGIIEYNFKNKEYNGLQKFQCIVEKANLSDDCRYLFKTNMKNFCVYDLKKGVYISTIFKDKFKQYNIDYTQNKIIIIDNISIIIKDFMDEKSPEKYVWLNKNPTKFLDMKLSRDFEILLGRSSNNEAVAYNAKTGYIIKKWENIDENWIDYCMTTFGGDRIAIKTNALLIKVWNFVTGKEEATFYGFNSHSLNFSSDGDYLVCGANNGNEIARIWNIPEQKYGIYKYNGSNNNFHTVAHLTRPFPEKLICCANDQKPMIFNSNTKELLKICECPYRFEEIYDIQSELCYNIFIIKGRDNQKRNMGILYRISDGALLETYENYTVLDLVRYEGILIFKCDNVNNGKLTSINLKNLNEPELVDFKIQGDKCELLNDHKSAIIEFGNEFRKEFNIINIKNGEFIGKIDYIKKYKKYSRISITADCDNDEIYFRYFEFLTPQETMAYLKKNIFNVGEDNDKK